MEAVLTFLERRRGLLDGVVISGGEPTLQPDLVAFAQAVREMGFVVKVDTNGSRPEVLNQLLAEELVDYLAMDVKGSPERYAEIVRRPVEMDVIKRSIEVIMNAGVDYEFRVTVLPRFHDEEEIARIGWLVTGARAVYLQNFRPGRTLDPSLAQEPPCKTETLETFQSVLEGYVESCVVRNGSREADAA